EAAAGPVGEPLLGKDRVDLIDEAVTAILRHRVQHHLAHGVHAAVVGEDLIGKVLRRDGEFGLGELAGAAGAGIAVGDGVDERWNLLGAGRRNAVAAAALGERGAIDVLPASVAEDGEPAGVADLSEIAGGGGLVLQGESLVEIEVRGAEPGASAVVPPLGAGAAGRARAHEDAEGLDVGGDVAVDDRIAAAVVVDPGIDAGVAVTSDV